MATASAVMSAVPALVTGVGLFVDAPAERVAEACAELPLGLLQFHGNETADFCASFGLPWMKAIRVAPDTDVCAAIDAYSGASAVLLDTYKAGVPGGTGEQFDWALVPQQVAMPLVLAGGLKPANVGAAVATARPFAVDVSGGVEEAPGRKSEQLIAEFMAAVRAADSETTTVPTEK